MNINMDVPAYFILLATPVLEILSDLKLREGKGKGKKNQKKYGTSAGAKD